MHMVSFLGALLHGTVLAILSFFVLFAASKADGRIKSFGLILGSWLAILALIAVVGMTFMPRTGPFGRMGYGMMQGSGQDMKQGAGPGWMETQPNTTKP